MICIDAGTPNELFRRQFCHIGAWAGWPRMLASRGMWCCSDDYWWRVQTRELHEEIQINLILRCELRSSLYADLSHPIMQGPVDNRMPDFCSWIRHGERLDPEADESRSLFRIQSIVIGSFLPPGDPFSTHSPLHSCNAWDSKQTCLRGYNRKLNCAIIRADQKAPYERNPSTPGLTPRTLCADQIGGCQGMKNWGANEGKVGTQLSIPMLFWYELGL